MAYGEGNSQLCIWCGNIPADGYISCSSGTATICRECILHLREFLTHTGRWKGNKAIASLLGHFPTIKDTVPEALRWAVFERDNFTCQCCGARSRLTIDHIIPEAKGGQTVKDNLQTLCRKCNSKKGTQISVTEKPLQRGNNAETEALA